MRRFAAWLATLLILACAALPPGPVAAAPALKGVALVIGEAKYQHLATLANPASDAEALARLFRALGFTVTEATDRDARRLQRDLENFTADAAGADVALVYYSGHGIEAGGENWLVPVDADGHALADPSHALVPLGGLLGELRAAAPLTLVFLDACRSNPFPPGAMLNAKGGAVPVAAAGLGAGKGVLAAGEGNASGGAGAVVGFAAEPGQAALDGPAGGTSPYAAALVRHLAAADGTEFGLVMRMVTEEVYLKTAGRQRPWVNETLTRALYFGAPAPEAAGAEAQILGERRQVLLTIAQLDGLTRSQVEAAASASGVPMDALFGLIHALGAEVPATPDGVQRLLAAQTARLKDILSEHQALSGADPEIARLAALADEAVAEGAVESAVRFREAARARFAAIAGDVDAAEANLKARRLEGGAVFADLAEAYELKGEPRAAAGNFRQAFLQIEKWDAALARDYKRKEADAWLSEGDVKGDNAAVARAVQVFGEALSLSPRAEVPGEWARAENNLGNAYYVMGLREAGTGALTQAVGAYRAALEVRRRSLVPRDWAKSENNLAIALAELAARTGDATLLDQAVAAYRAALSETPRSAEPAVWATIMSNLGNALADQGGSHLAEAAAAHRAALAERPRGKVPLDWAGTQSNLGNALVAMGRLKRDTALIDDGIAAYRLALEERTRTRMPLEWAAIEYNLGNALAAKGELETGTASFAAAVAAYRLALAERSFERTPLAYAETQYNIGRQLWKWAGRSSDPALLREAVAAYGESLRVYTHDRNADDWAAVQYNLGNALADLGMLTADGGRLSDAIACYHGALEIQTEAAVPLDWAMTQNNLGSALMALAELENSAADARAARAAVELAARTYAAQGLTQFAPLFARRLAEIDRAIARLEGK